MAAQGAFRSDFRQGQGSFFNSFIASGEDNIGE